MSDDGHRDAVGLAQMVSFVRKNSRGYCINKNRASPEYSIIGSKAFWNHGELIDLGKMPHTCPDS